MRRTEDRAPRNGEAPEAPETEPSAVSPEVEALQQQLAAFQDQLKTMRESYLRALADLDNTRKRARHENAEAQLRASADVLLDVLPIVDNFERALETITPGSGVSPEVQTLYDGIILIYRQLLDMLARRGVRPIEAVGHPFDTQRHEAVVQVPAGDDEADGTVALETQKGYVMGDRVLRPSKVGVAVREERREERKEGEGESG